MVGTWVLIRGGAFTAVTTRRRHSKEIRRSRLSGRDELASALESAIASTLSNQDPTLPIYGVRIAAMAAAMVASQLAVQTQTTQRALLSVEDDIAEYAADFVDGMVRAATKSVVKKLKGFRASAPEKTEGMQLPDDWAGPVAGPTVIEKHYGIPRSTLYRWQKRNEVIAINSRTSSKPVFPLRQFVDGRPMDGIAEAISILGEQRRAWKWLISPNERLDGRVPLDLLSEDRISAVLNAARSE